MWAWIERRPLWPAWPPPGLHLEPRGRQVDLVVEDGDVAGLELEEAHRLAHRLAGEVHEGLGLEERHLLGPEAAFGDLALELRAPGREAVVGGDPVHRHEADVVPVPGILRARVPEPHEKPHGPLRLRCRVDLPPFMQ